MRFALSDDQAALRDGAAEVLAGLCMTADVRAVVEHPGDPTAGRAVERWSALAELGAIGLLAPEDDGGLGLGMVEVVAVLMEAGKVALPEPLGLHAGVVVPALASVAGASIVSATAGGELLVGIGGIEIDADGPVIEASDGPVVTTRVSHADRAGVFLLVTADGDGAAVHLVPASEVTVEMTPSLAASRRLGSVAWTPTPATRVATGLDAALLVDDLATRLCVVTAAELCGLAEGMLDMTATYTADRQQFGKPIGSFQSIKHLLADVRIALEFARPAVLRAAWAIDVDDDLQAHDAAVAKSLASDLAVLAAKTCLQVHGGIGYTWEHDLHLFGARARALAAEAGSAAASRARALRLSRGA
ncbi:MAG: acyl-CoA dehydrogenase family protein [Planctomycetia bacterium]